MVGDVLNAECAGLVVLGEAVAGGREGKEEDGYSGLLLWDWGGGLQWMLRGEGLGGAVERG